MSAVTAPLRRAPIPTPRTRAPHLRVVQAPRRRHTLAYLVAVVLTIAAGVFAAVALNALAAATAVEARALEAEVVEAERHYAHLVAEVAALEDPARIRDAALELGLVPAGPGRYITLERNLPADGAAPVTQHPGATADPLKPILSAER